MHVVNKQREVRMTNNYIPHKKILTHIVISTDRLVYLGNCRKQSTFLVSYPHAWQVYKLSIHFLQHYITKAFLSSSWKLSSKDYFH